MKIFLLTFGWIVGVANVLAVIFFAYVGWGPKWPRRRNFGIPAKQGFNDLSRWKQFGGSLERPPAPNYRAIRRNSAITAPYSRETAQAVTDPYAIVAKRTFPTAQIHTPPDRDRREAPFGYFCPAECCDDIPRCPLRHECAKMATRNWEMN